MRFWYIILGVWLVVLAMQLPLSPLQTRVMSAHAQGVPLVVVRFNQRKVFYEKQLYMAIEKAVAIKPSVTFELVNYIPVTGNAEQDAALAVQAETNLRMVAQTFREMGVPASRISVRKQLQSSIKYDEVHVYVH